MTKVFPAISRSAVLTTVWIGGLSLPFVILAFRAALDLVGWITVFYMITYGPVLLFISIGLGAFMHLIPKDIPLTRGLWRPVGGFLVWFVSNLFAVAFVISDLTDQDDTPSPMAALIPPEFQFPAAGIIVAVGALGVIFMVVSIFRLRREFVETPNYSAK